MADKYSALWVSHSSIQDFLISPRLYYLKNMYRNPTTNRKVRIMSPALALGLAVHEVLESISTLPAGKRFDDSLIAQFDEVWEKVSGKKGGFTDPATEHEYKERGKAMIRRVMQNPGPLKNKAVKIHMDLPHYYLSEEENIILCGKIDWLEYLEDTDEVNILDFKTSRGEEREGSLQLPIYTLLVHNLQKRKAAKASYWYLERDDAPVEATLPDLEDSRDRVLKIAREINTARKLGKLGKMGDHPATHGYERILKGEGELVKVDDFNQEIYILPENKDEDKSEII